MSLGIVVKGLNAVYFKKWLVFFFEVITGLIIMLGLFGWMDFLIFSKWTYTMQPYSYNQDDIDKINTAPSIITVMINNFLYGGYPNPPETNPQYYFVPGQRSISEFLVLISIAVIPLMLCVKPCVESRQHHDNHGAEFERVEPVDEDAQPIRNSQSNDDRKADIQTYEELLNNEGGADGHHSGTEAYIH